MKLSGVIERLLQRRALARWQQAASKAPGSELAVLRAQRQQARQLHGPLQELMHVADSRLALPRIGSTTFAKPGGTDWAWRPQAWRGALTSGGLAPAKAKAKLGRELTVYHDCKEPEVSLRQQRNLRDNDLAPFGLVFEVFGFDGTFLSLVVEVPPDACKGLQKRHVLRLSATVEREKPITLLARLNIKHGPNTEQILLTLPDEPEAHVEFDLAYGQLNEKRAERMWVDLMFETPSMNQVTIRDLNFCRYPRAEV